MKVLYFQFILTIFLSSAYGQADSVYAVNVFEHEINENGQRTVNKKVIRQDTYDLNGYIIRTVFYSKNKIEGYTFYFYEENLPISKERFDSDFTPDSIVRVEYDVNKQKSKEILYTAQNNSLQKTLITHFNAINGKNHPVIATNPEGKWMIKYKYSNSGETFLVKEKYRKNYHPSGLKLRIRQTTNKGDTLKQEQIKLQYFNKEAEEYSVDYEYETGSDKLSNVKKYDDSKRLIFSQELDYNSQGMLKSRGKLDSNRHYLGYWSYEGKFYKVQLGEQEMINLNE